MIINVHGGHSLVCRGASALLDEVVEDRNVKNRVIQLLRQQGHTVYDCTDDVGTTQKENLSNIVRKCNSHSVDLDVSIHLNSGRSDLKGDGKTGGVEVYGYDNGVKEVANRICSKISQSLGITNRGFKISKSLYVLSNTKAKAILVECCFVDDKDDADRWNAVRCAEAIYTALTGKEINKIAPEQPRFTSVEKKEESIKQCPYLVRVSIDDLCIRTGPGVTYTWTGRYTGKGVFTIVEVAGNWGRLKSGAGWISLAYCTEV